MSKSVTWKLEPHTQAKHIILRNYLRAWFPIMGRWNKRILYMDGYAGPGEYDGGQEGSPIIAIKEALNYLDFCEKYNISKPEIVFIFIEADKERFAHLKAKIKRLKLKKEIKIDVIHSTFEDVTKEIIDSLEEQEASLAPAFIFIDPCGYNLPFELIQKLMAYDKCEIFINFMYEFINRFIERDGQEAVLTRLFGGDEWKKLRLGMMSPRQRKQSIHGLYQKQLEERAARYVRSFEIKGKRNSTKYFLFYGTNHKLGLEKMKTAMWKVDTGGGFTFSDATDPNQVVLFGDKPDYEKLKNLIVNKFGKKITTIEEIEDFVLCDTPFLPTHFKRSILAPMEKSGELVVLKTSRKKSGSFPKGTIIKFE